MIMLTQQGNSSRQTRKRNLCYSLFSNHGLGPSARPNTRYIEQSYKKNQ